MRDVFKGSIEVVAMFGTDRGTMPMTNSRPAIQQTGGRQRHPVGAGIYKLHFDEFL
jgi:hypothetical protein